MLFYSRLETIEVHPIDNIQAGSVTASGPGFAALQCLKSCSVESGLMGLPSPYDFGGSVSGPIRLSSR